MNPANNGGRGDGLKSTMKERTMLSSARDLSQQLDALALEDDDDDTLDNDPMNISDFINSKGELTGLSEWTDSEQEDISRRTLLSQQFLRAKTNVNDKSVSARGPGDQTTNANTSIAKSSCSTKAVPGTSHDHACPNGCCNSPGYPRNTVNLTRHVLPGTRSQPMFIRAPNFRTPGGYKPPEVETEPRDLTDEQIIQEVKEMYAKDRLDEYEEALDDYSNQEKDEKNKDSLDFLLNNSHFPERDRDREQENQSPVHEPEVIKSASWVCEDKEKQVQSEPDADAIVNDFTDCCTLQEATNYVSANRHSANSRTENLAQLSRLWNEIQDTKQKLEQDIHSLAHPGSPAAASSPKPNQKQVTPVRNENEKTGTSTTVKPPPQKSAVLEAIKAQPLPRRSFSFGKRAYGVAAEPPRFGEGRCQDWVRTASSDRCGAGDSADIDSTRSPENVRPRRTLKSKGKTMRQRRHVGGTAHSQALVPLAAGARGLPTEDELGLNQRDIDEILHETDLHESDLDEILSEISDHIPDVGVSGVRNFFKQSNALSHQVGVSVRETYKQKYFEERYRRDHCENEISKLQKELLEMSEKIAVVDGILHGKDTTINKLTKVCDRLQSQLKSQGKSMEEKMSEVEKENTELKSKLSESKEKVSAYQQELDKALQLGSDLKAKVQTVLDELEAEKKLGNEQHEKLKAKVDTLEASLGSLQIEKESSLRALRDCQDSLDTTKSFFNAVSEELQVTKAEYKLLGEKSKDLESANAKLKSEMVLLDTENSEMAARIVSLEQEIAGIKSKKVILESDFRRKLTEEREKLHEYYNTKIKEILHKESQKMIEAEKEFVELHEEKLKRVQDEANDRLEQMQTKYAYQVDQMKMKFEAQLGSLKKENEEKSKLIGTVSDQLRNFSERGRDDEIGIGRAMMVRGRSQDEDLESIVTSSAQRNGLDGKPKLFGSGEF